MNTPWPAPVAALSPVVDDGAAGLSATDALPDAQVNGKPVPLACEDSVALCDFLRDQRLMSVRMGCEHGVCGTCNVLVDGEVVRSCLTFAKSCAGQSVTTAEGLQDDLAKALRDAFQAHHALQCGYCTSGMLVTAHDLLTRHAALDEPTVRRSLAGNICRCTGYHGAVEAILAVARARAQQTVN